MDNKRSLRERMAASVLSVTVGLLTARLLSRRGKGRL